MKNHKKDFYNSFPAKMGFFLHHNFAIHILLLVVFNIIAGFAVIGFFELIGYQIFLVLKIVDFIFYIIIASLLEAMIKLFFLKYFLELVFKSKGLLTLIAQCLIFYLTTFIIDGIRFKNSVFLNIIIFTLLFMAIRTILIIIYQRYYMSKMRK